MASKQKDALVLVLLIIVLVIINYSWLDDVLDNFLNTDEQVHVDRIIDGDTIESNKTSIRLLGINTPEKGELYYEEAKRFLENEILNKTVNLKYGKERYDKYDRVLAYVFLDNVNINLKLVEEGFANYYFYDGRDKYSNALEDAWDDCIENKVNLCAPSQHACAQCIEIISKDAIINNCDFECDITGWRIKGEGRQDFLFEGVLNVGREIEFELELTPEGDTLFLRDDAGGLVVWNSY